MSYTFKAITIRASGELRSNIRLQWLLLASFVLLSWWLLDTLWAARSSLLQHAAQLEAQGRDYAALRSETVWNQRAVDAETLAERLTAEIPVVDSPGIAQATVQSWLQSRTSGMTGRPAFSVESARAVDGLPGMLRVRATVGGTSPRYAVLELLSRLEQSTNLMVIDSLTLNSDPAIGFSLTLSAYFRTSGLEGRQ